MEAWLSVIAILISVATIIFELINSRKLNRINLESIFYNEIFLEFLIKDIPLARNGISFKDGYINKSYKNLSQAILNLKKKILYFKFRNKEFFDNMESQITKLDELLVNQAKAKSDINEQAKFLLDVDKRIYSLYECIFKEYNT